MLNLAKSLTWQKVRLRRAIAQPGQTHQSSTVNPGILLKWATLWVAIAILFARAMPAISKSISSDSAGKSLSATSSDLRFKIFCGIVV